MATAAIVHVIELDMWFSACAWTPDPAGSASALILFCAAMYSHYLELCLCMWFAAMSVTILELEFLAFSACAFEFCM